MVESFLWKKIEENIPSDFISIIKKALDLKNLKFFDSSHILKLKIIVEFT